MPRPDARQNSVRVAVVFLLIAVSLGGASDGFSKLLSDTQELGPIVVARYLPVLIVLLATRPPVATMRLLATRAPGMQLLRAASPLFITVLMVMALRLMPLAEATVVLFAGPFLVIMFAGTFLSERTRPASWLGVFLGFIAVLCSARPGFDHMSVAMILPTGAAFCYALFQLLSRKLIAQGESPETMLLWTVIVGSVAALPFAFMQWSSPAPSDWVLFALVGMTYGGCHYCFAQAFARAPANVLTPFSYFQIIAATVFGYVAFGDVPDLWTFLGIGLILLAGVLVFLGRE